MIDPAFQPSWWDLVAVAVVVLVVPQITTFITMPRVRALPPDVQDTIRPRFYAEAMVLQWVLGFVALNHVLLGHLPAATLGVSLRPEFMLRLAGGVAAAAAFIVFLAAQRRGIKAQPEGRELVRNAIARYAWIIPRSRGQQRTWLAVSVHAGVGEELFFRGYLLAMLNWYLPVWAAALIAVVLFGLGHTYQGVKGVLGTATIGLVLMGLYLLTGSLWVSMLAHAVYDMHGGAFAHWALYEDAPQTNA